MAKSGSDCGEVRSLTELAERIAALERKGQERTDRLAYLLVCHQKLRDVRDDLIAVEARLSVLAPIDVESKRGLLRSLQINLDAPRLPEVNPRQLVGLFECLWHIDT